MWAELFLWNKDNLISEIDMFSDALATMRQKLVDDDREGLEKCSAFPPSAARHLIKNNREAGLFCRKGGGLYAP